MWTWIFQSEWAKTDWRQPLRRGSSRRRSRAAIVIDAGSAITLDMVSPAGDFLGGAILPGWQIMAHALSTGTHLLPYVDCSALDAAPDIVGRSTEKAIASGLYWGSLGAVRELVQRMSERWEQTPDQLLAGGDLQMLLPHLGPRVRCVPDMVLRGVIETVRAMPPDRGRQPGFESG